MSTVLRRLPLIGVHNLRDIGGYPIGTDRVIKWHRIFRSDGLFDLCTEDKDYILYKLKIKTIIDMRTKRELKIHPNTFENEGAVNYINLGIFPEKFEDYRSDDFDSLKNIYKMIAQRCMNNIGKVFNAIADNIDDTILFHCTAGKDRAGIVAALLLSVCGVSIWDVVADYEISFTLLSKNLDKIADKSQPGNMNLMHSNPENIISFLEYINKHHNSAYDYLINCGVKVENLEKIRHKLITKI